MSKGRKRRSIKWVLLFLVLLLILGGALAYRYYRWIHMDNIALKEGEERFLYVPTGGDFDGLVDSLEAMDLLKDTGSFFWVAELKGLEGSVRSGRYRIEGGMSNNELVNHLRGGLDEPVQVTFNDLRTMEGLAGEVTRKLEMTEEALLEALKDPAVAARYGFDQECFRVMFIPNTYELYWDVSVEAFLERMKKEYDRFWNEKRRKKAEAIDLDPVEVSILASIVEAEQLKQADERPKVAGLFLNRLDRGMRLESDPTLVYAIGDFSIQRVLDKDRSVESPYNTYRYRGLPPGPIRIPSPRSIDAVLNAEDHDHLFMCAKPDTSGYHNFARTHSEHVRNARKYQRWLNKGGVYR